MQQFVVPQFIDVEDKIIGPITVRQFIIILVGAGVAFIAYKLSDFALFITELIFILAITFGFAFIKINGRPVHYLLLNIFQTSKRPKLRIWNKIFVAVVTDQKDKKKPAESLAVVPRKQVRATRLAELALIVDTGGVYQGEPLPSNGENKELKVKVG